MWRIICRHCVFQLDLWFTNDGTDILDEHGAVSASAHRVASGKVLYLPNPSTRTIVLSSRSWDRETERWSPLHQSLYVFMSLADSSLPSSQTSSNLFTWGLSGVIVAMFIIICLTGLTQQEPPCTCCSCCRARPSVPSADDAPAVELAAPICVPVADDADLSETHIVEAIEVALQDDLSPRRSVVFRYSTVPESDL
jgi:hypothetical protein